MAISTNGTVIARLAGGLYNSVMSNATYLEVASQDPSALANTLYSRDFAKSTDLAVATTLIKNIGLSTVAGLDNWVAAQLTAAGTAGKGAKIVSLLNDFSGMTADTTYGAAATAFNTKVDAALAASQKTGTVEGKFETAGVVAVTNATFTLTTSIEAIAGGAGDDTINASATNGTTGAAQTSINSGDSINGGAGTDTLNITITAANNNSLTGLTVAAVETVNITGSNNLAASATAAATATTAKATSAAALTTANASLALATAQESAAKAVSTLAGVTATPAASGEPAVVSASTVTATTAPQLAAATKYVNTPALSDAATAAAATSLPTGVTAFTLAQYVAAGANALLSADGLVISGTTAATRAGVLATAATNVNVAVGATTNSSDLTEDQLAAAAQKVLDTATTAHAAGAGAAGAVATAVALLRDISDAGYTALATTTYTKAQLVAAATAALTNEYTGVALTVNLDIFNRATALDTYADAVVAVVGDYTVAQLNTAAASALSSSTGATLITIGDDKANIAARSDALVTLTGTVKGTAATAAGTALTTDIAAANTLTAAQAAAVAATVSAAQFADATQVWLKGVESNNTSVTDVAATQTVGLDAVTGMTNSVTYGATVTAGSIASNASAGTLTVTGAKLTSLAISGTGSTGLTLVDGSTTDTIKTLSVATSAATVADVAGATALTTVTSTGVGGLSLNGAGAKLASVTTGEGADSIRIATATVKDDTTTTVDETVNASVNTGAGADSIRVSTSGAGLASVAGGEGNDTVFITSVGTGATTVDAGAGNDSVTLGVTLASAPSLTIAGGDGTDTITMTGLADFTATDFLRVNSALTGFEAVKFSSLVGATATPFDVSKLAIGTVTSITFNDGATNTITKVGADQKLVLAKVAAVTESTTAPMAPTSAATAATGLTASAAGYVASTTGVATVYGTALDVTASGNGTTALVLNGASAKVTVNSTGASSTTSQASTVNLGTSDVQALEVVLTSARGTGTNAATEYMSTFNASTALAPIVNSSATPATAGENLEALSSLKVSGSGVFSIFTGSVSKTLAKLTTIDLSGMTSFADLDLLGSATAGSTTPNKSTSAVTLNNAVSETVILGGAKDTVTTSSTVANPDTITGFTLTASVPAATPATIDATRSDKLVVGVAGFAKFVPTATTFAGALTEAGAAAGANLVFAFGGDTYVYIDNGTAGLDDADGLVKLTGLVDLDLLIATGAITA